MGRVLTFPGKFEPKRTFPLHIRARTPGVLAAQLFYCTMRVTVVEWDRAPEVAVTVTV